jgi:single-strand DNA-binding protein
VPADLNRVTLVGRLTRDPELRHTAGGDAVCSMRVAVSSRSRDDTGSWGDRSNYFAVTVFGRQAETVTTYLSKGRRVGIDGRLSWREWQDREGNRRESVEVIANDVFFLDSRNEAGGDPGAPVATGSADTGLPVDGSDFEAPAPARGDDDIPF